ncbi:hypothetical protein BGX38DRAFT_1157808 [Terfezia claveryi]|nr:hypothetical protein BGX38DRAFT_1157808 [Terfezia claveryi]
MLLLLIIRKVLILGKPFFINHLHILLYPDTVLSPFLLLSFPLTLPLSLLLLLLYRYFRLCFGCCINHI